MKKLILIVVLYFSTLLWRCSNGLGGGEVFAQQPQIDSLQNLLINHHSNDAEQLNLLLAIADANELSNPTKGIIVIDAAIALAQKLKRQQEQAIAYNLKARLFLMKQQPVEATVELQKSISINRSLNNQSQLNQNILTVAQFVFCQQKSDTTINYINEAHDLFVNSKDNLSLGKIALFYGVYDSFSNSDTALNFYSKAKTYFEKTNRLDWIAWAQFYTATSFTSLNKNQQALDCFTKMEASNRIIKSEFIAQNIFCTRGYLYSSMAEHPKALDNFIKGLKIAEAIGDKNMQATMLNNIGTTFGEMGNNVKAMEYFNKEIDLGEKLNDKNLLSLGHQNIGWVYYYKSKFKEALAQAELSLQLALEAKQLDHIAESYGFLGNVNEKLGMYKEAFSNLQLALASNTQQGNYLNICDNLLALGRTIKNSGNIKLTDAAGGLVNQNEKNTKAIYFTTQALNIADSLSILAMKRDALLQLSEFYQNANDTKHSFEYYKQYVAVKDIIMSSDNLKSINNLQLKYDTEKKEQEITLLNKDKEIQQKEISKKKTERNGFIAGFVLVLLIGGVTYNRYRLKQKTNRKLALTLERLHQTQKQLIEQEKFASFGQLTAGIAHEIQNPLNFVINFSELSNSLFDELTNTSNAVEQLEIINDLGDNINKIERHTNRADNIVKSMLMHSRESGFEKQLTNINELCKEAVGFSMHAIRTNFPDFNCNVVTGYEENLPEIILEQQDISRVLINLLSNAFYAVNEKKQNNASANYDPEINISTYQKDKLVFIKISDNGNGIPEEIKNKIFQPFFTTKPTNLGTGLGLSISYDIIKAHGGNISLQSTANMGAIFIITLPVSA